MSAGDADDVVQEVFLVVHRRLADFDATRNIQAWLYGILRMIVSTHRRSARRAHARQTALTLEAKSDVDFQGTGAHSLEIRETLAIVADTLQQMEEGRRELFFLVEIEELTVPQAAEALCIPLNTAYSRLRLGRADFKALLAREKVS